MRLSTSLPPELPLAQVRHQPVDVHIELLLEPLLDRRGLLLRHALERLPGKHEEKKLEPTVSNDSVVRHARLHHASD